MKPFELICSQLEWRITSIFSTMIWFARTFSAANAARSIPLAFPRRRNRKQTLTTTIETRRSTIVMALFENDFVGITFTFVPFLARNRLEPGQQEPTQCQICDIWSYLEPNRPA